MATHLIQLPTHAAGSAAFQITSAACNQLYAPENLEISILQPGQVERHLDPRNPDVPWTTASYRFRPLEVYREGNALMVEIDYGVTYHLRANQPYRLMLHRSDGSEIEERFTGLTAIRRPSSVPTQWTPPAGPQGPVVAPRSQPVMLPPEPKLASPPEAIETRSPAEAQSTSPLIQDGTVDHDTNGEMPPTGAGNPPRGHRFVKSISIVLTMLFAIAVAAALKFWPESQPHPQLSEKESLASVQNFIRSGAGVAQIFEKAEALAKAGKLLDAQFLLYKNAAEKGNRDAARIIGSFYDPDTWESASSPLPAANPAEALRWYKQAADAGDAEAQYRLGMMLKKGRSEEPNGPELAVYWFEKAASQGHVQAKRRLGK